MIFIYKYGLSSPLIIFFIRIVLGIIFIISGASKLFELTSFLETIKCLSILPYIFTPVAASIISIVELALGMLISIVLFIKMTALGMSALLLIFLVVILPDALDRIGTNCGCFGNIITEKFDLTLILRDIILFIMTIIVLNQKKYRYGFDYLIEKVNGCMICR